MRGGVLGILKRFLVFFIVVSALFGVEIGESNLQDLIKKCNEKDKIACGEVSRFYGKSASHKNKEATNLWVEYALKGCELKDGESCYIVAVHYADVVSFPRYFQQIDEAKEEEYYTKACDYKYALACNMLGLIYSIKSQDAECGEKKSAKNKSKQFFKKACDLGYELSCREILDLPESE